MWFVMMMSMVAVYDKRNCSYVIFSYSILLYLSCNTEVGFYFIFSPLIHSKYSYTRHHYVATCCFYAVQKQILSFRKCSNEVLWGRIGFIYWWRLSQNVVYGPTSTPVIWSNKQLLFLLKFWRDLPPTPINNFNDM